LIELLFILFICINDLGIRSENMLQTPCYLNPALPLATPLCRVIYCYTIAFIYMCVRSLCLRQTARCNDFRAGLTQYRSCYEMEIATNTCRLWKNSVPLNNMLCRITSKQATSRVVQEDMLSSNQFTSAKSKPYLDLQK